MLFLLWRMSGRYTAVTVPRAAGCWLGAIPRQECVREGGFEPGAIRARTA
jgi:hypothetical protein